MGFECYRPRQIRKAQSVAIPACVLITSEGYIVPNLGNVLELAQKNNIPDLNTIISSEMHNNVLFSYENIEQISTTSALFDPLLTTTRVCFCLTDIPESMSAPCFLEFSQLKAWPLL